jgi:serine/threonine protein kinase/tetratricopeptide (TPR) repeat protein
MSFRPDEWARVKDVFEGARPLPAPERKAYLAAACATEPGVRGHVERLLAAHQLASGFLENPPVLSGAAPVAPPLEWDQIAGFELLTFIGAGGMGEVYKAYDRKLDRPVALKLLPAHLTDRPEWLRRFRAEARAASSLNHPHILVVHDFGEFRERPFIVMEFVEGQTLRERIDAGALAVKDAISITIQVASALAASHARGIVHRDIKPENVMRRPDGYVKVLDFGLARQLAGVEDGALTATQPEVLVGTLRYMSPEQSRGEPVRAPSDVFSLGLLLFEMLAGLHPFHADSNIGVLHGIQSGTPPASGVGAEVDGLLSEMLQKHARLRPTATDVAARLNGLAARVPAVEYVSRRRTSVGRERERADLRTAFEAADRGNGQFVAVSGEPGIGKSTLVEDFLSEIATPAWIGRGRCSERLAGAEAHLPFLEALDSLLARDPSVAAVMKQMAPGWYVQIAPLSAEESSAARLIADTKSGSAERLMREMAALLQELARTRPFVLLLDDVHWADVSTIDLLGYLAPKLARLRGLVLITFRPSDLAMSRHPFLRLKADLGAHGVLREVPVAFLSGQDVAQYVSAQMPEAPLDLAGLIYRKTEGSPLFMVDLVRYLRERGVSADWAGEIERNIPESLRGMIERTIESLDDEERQLLRVAAVQGFEFDSAIVAQVLERDPADVEDALQSFERVHGLVQLLREQELPSRLFSLRYQFVHVLYQSALYGSVSPTRKAVWSGKVAEALEREHGDRKRAVAAELALLYEMARDPWRASEHFLAAAQVASSRFATREALAFARKGLACVAQVRDQPDVEARELALQKALLHPLAVVEGYGTPATEQVSQRIIELAERLEDHGSLFAALDGALFVHMARGECVDAARIADRMVAVAEKSRSEIQLMNAHMWATIARHHSGDLLLAREHALACIGLGRPSNQAARLTTLTDPIVGAVAELSRILWMLGETRESLSQARQGLSHAREIGHPNSLAFALLFHGWMYGYRQDWETCLRSTAEGIALSSEHGLAQAMAWLRCVHGWALAHTDRVEDGLVELQSAIADSLRIMGQVAMPNFVAMLAEVLLIRGEHARALDEIERILLVVNETTHDAYFNAELHRLAAECHLAFGEPEPAEAALNQAIETARAQGALTFELRAATALGRLWAGRGERDQARRLVQRVLDALGDAEETVDVRRAHACLTEWAET